jgi:hypothetical protein
MEAETEQTARAEFGRLYWNDQLRRRMERELEKSRRLTREPAEQAAGASETAPADKCQYPADVYRPGIASAGNRNRVTMVPSTVSPTAQMQSGTKAVHGLPVKSQSAPQMVGMMIAQV